jgi:hypothetical protein
VPAKAFDIKEYVNDLFKDTSIPEDQRKVVEGILASEAVANRLRESALRQQDYSRQTQELAQQREAAKQEVQAIKDRYDASYLSVAKWKEGEEKNLQAWQRELTAAREKEARLVAAVERAKQQGLDDKDLGLDGQPLTTTRRTEEETAKPKYVTAETLEEERRRFGTGVTDFTAGVIDINNRHAKLFPGEVPDMAALVQEARTTNKSVEDVWSAKYGVPERIQTIQQEALDAKLKAEREAGLKEGRELAMRELATGQVVPGTPGGRPHNPVGPWATVQDVKDQFKPIENGQGPDPVMNAVEAYRSQKYTAKQGTA